MKKRLVFQVLQGCKDANSDNLNCEVVEEFDNLDNAKKYFNENCKKIEGWVKPILVTFIESQPQEFDEESQKWINSDLSDTIEYFEFNSK